MQKQTILLRPALEGVHAALCAREALAVRTESGDIAVRILRPQPASRAARMPFIRGAARLMRSIFLPFRLFSLSRTMRPQELSRPSRSERDAAATLHCAPLTLTWLVVALSVLVLTLACAALPLLAESALAFCSWRTRAALLCVLRCLLLMGVVGFVFRLKFLRRTAMYLGAANKAAGCLTDGRPLTIENALACPRLAPQSDGAFLLLTALLMIVLGALLPLDVASLPLRALIRLALFFALGSVLNELILPLERRPNAPISRLLASLQRLFTLEPPAEMLEVAITAIRAAKGELSSADASGAEKTS